MQQKKLLIIGGVLVAAILAIIFTAYSPARAADKGRVKVTEQNVFADAPVAKISWSGVYVGLHGGYNAANIELTNPGFGIDGLSATGLSGGGDVGADIQVPNACVVFGARAGYTFANTEFAVSPGLFSAKIKNGWNVDGRLGCAVGTALPYLFVGYVQDQTSTTGLADKTRAGWRVGGGIEVLLPTGLSNSSVRPTVALEYIHTDYSDFTISSTNVNVTDESVMLRLNLRFQ